MLTENEVIYKLQKHLERQGFSTKVSSTSEHGVDLIAIKQKRRLYLEVKGQTSSKPDTNRYGKEFTPNQKLDHVAKAIYTAMKTLNQIKNVEVGIALPNDKTHEKIVQAVLLPLKLLKIKVFMVSPDGSVNELFTEDFN